MSALVYLSAVPWASIAQRPHKFVEWFHADHGGPVLWVDPYPTRMPARSDLRRLLAPAREPGRKVPPWMRLIPVRALPVEPVPGGTAFNRRLWKPALDAVAAFTRANPGCRLVIGKPSRFALSVLESQVFDDVSYDAMDDFPSFYAGLSRRALACTEQALAARADRIMVSATRLKEKFATHAPRIVLARNACAPESLPSPAEQAGMRESDLVGYLGTLASWFDWQLLLALAQSSPTKRFRLIGPLLTALPAQLPPNVELRPACSHEAAMREMARFSIGLIPFLRNTLTDSVDPVKYYEYRALGIPVISTPFGEMPEHAGEDAGVFLIKDVAEARVVLDRASSRASDTAAQMEAFRRANGWANRFRTIMPAG